MAVHIEEKLLKLAQRARDTSCSNVKRVLINRMNFLSAIYGIDVDACDLAGHCETVRVTNLLEKPQRTIWSH